MNTQHHNIITQHQDHHGTWNHHQEELFNFKKLPRLTFPFLGLGPPGSFPPFPFVVCHNPNGPPGWFNWWVGWERKLIF